LAVELPAADLVPLTTLAVMVLPQPTRLTTRTWNETVEAAPAAIGLCWQLVPEHVHPEELGPCPCRLIPTGSDRLADTAAVATVPASYTSTATRATAPRLSGPLTTMDRRSLADPGLPLELGVLGEGVGDAVTEPAGDGAADADEER
jgi:hypothetical protein